MGTKTVLVGVTSQNPLWKLAICVRLKLKMRRQIAYSFVSPLICIFSVISACKHPEVCFNAKQLDCSEEIFCENGDCYVATDSMIIEPEELGAIKYCPQGFDKYKDYCWKVDYERKSWDAASRDWGNGVLASLLTEEEAKISAEYLQINIPGSNIGVWTSGKVDITTSKLSWSGDTALTWHGSNSFSSLSPVQGNTCLALTSNHYTYWDLVTCETKLLSLRSADMDVINNAYKCRCKPGYRGRNCLSEYPPRYKPRELKNPQSIECAPQSLIYIDFALYEYRTKGSSNVCAAPNTLALLRYLCQGKSFCTLEPSVLKSYFGYVCDEIHATLTVEYSCLPKNGLSCPDEMIEIEERGSKNCVLVTKPKTTWNDTMKFCEDHSGQLAAFHDIVSYRHFRKAVTDLKDVTTFWFFDKVPDIRPNTRRPDVCTKAMIDIERDPTNLTVIKECSENLYGLCAFPPVYKVNAYKELRPTMEAIDTTVDPLMDTMVDTPMDTTVDTPMGTLVNIPMETTVDTPMDTMVEPLMDTTVQTPMDTTVDPPRDTMVDTTLNDPTETLPTGKYCPEQTYDGLILPATIPGHTVPLPCPHGQYGYAIWTCETNEEFTPIRPDFSNCVTLVSADIEELKNNHPDVVVTNLAETIKRAETISSGDLLRAIDLLDQAIVAQQDIVHTIDDKTREGRMNTFTSGVVNTTGAVLGTDRLTSWFGLKPIHRAETVTKLLADVDSTGILHAATLTSATRTTFEFSGTLHLYVESRNTTDDSQLELPNIIVPSEAFQIANRVNSRGNLPNVVPIVVATYNTIGLIMPIGGHYHNFINVTQVIGATFNMSIQLDHDKVTVTIQKPTEVTSLNQSLCVFWNELESQWSTDGCEMSDTTNDTHFVCKCDHMTSFAVLMSFNPQKVKIMALNLITIIGCSISIFCLAACIVTFSIVRSVRTFCYKVHLHLCISLMTADIVLITAYFYKAQHLEVDAYCTALAMLLHYFYLATFMWMFLEGVQIYLALVRVFAPVRNRGYVYFLIGYGIPGLVVGISAGVNIEGYASETDCFMDTERGFIWGFIAFVLMTLIFNTVLVFLSLKSASRLRHMRNVKQTELAKQWLWQITILHPLLGFTWIFGLLQLGDQLVFSYIFTILNSLQGMFIFLFHFFRNENARHYFARICLNFGAGDAKTARVYRTPVSSPNGQRKEAESDHFVTHRKLGPRWKKDIPIDRITSGHLETDLNEYVVLHSAHVVDRTYSDT